MVKIRLHLKKITLAVLRSADETQASWNSGKKILCKEMQNIWQPYGF